MQRIFRFHLTWPLAVVLGLAGCAGTAPDRTPPRGGAADERSTAFDGGQIRLNVRGERCELTLSGTVNEGAVRRARPLLDQMEQSRCTERTWVLAVNGGTIGDAVTLGAMVRNRNMDTRVAAGAVCETPCWLVLAAGRERVVPEAPQAARIVFTALPPDADFGRQTCAGEWSRNQQLTLTRYLRAMLPSAPANALYQKLLAADCRSNESFSPDQALAIGLATRTR